MANPQPTDAHLRIAHSIGEQLMVSHFTEQQRRILDLILRLSWGCGKKAALIPCQKDFEVIGVSESHIKGHLDWLIDARVITREENLYSFNKDFDQWRVSRALKYSPKKLTDLVSLNLAQLTENGSPNLRNTEESTSVKGKSVTSELATPKERVKEILKESSTSTAAVGTKDKPDQLTENGSLEKPNIFTLYEQEIGKLTPQVAEQLKDIEKQYPADWIPDAFKESAGRARSYKYIEGILKRWATEGKPSEKAQAAAPRPAIPDAVLTAAKEQPSPDIGPGEAWEQVKALLKAKISVTNYSAYFEGTTGLEWRGVCLVVQASPIHAEYYATRMRSAIENVLFEVTGNKCLVICEAPEEVAA